MRRRATFIRLGIAAWLAIAAIGVASEVRAEDPPADSGASALEDPVLEGEAKKAYDEERRRYDKRFKAVKNRDELLQLLNELDAAGTRAARDWLITYAKTVKSAEYRAKAFESLAKIGGTKAVGFLCGKSGVRSPDFLVQKQAVEAVAKAADKRSIGPLLDVLDDPALKMETVAAVCETLAKIDPSDLKVQESLRRVAGDRRDTVRAAALEALGHGADDATFALLMDTLQHDKNAAARAGAAKGLGHAGRGDAIPALRAAVSGEKSQPVREAALQALKTLGDTGG